VGGARNSRERGFKLRVDDAASSIHQALSAGLSSGPQGGKGPKSAGGSWADNLASFRSDTAAREKAGPRMTVCS